MIRALRRVRRWRARINCFSSQPNIESRRCMLIVYGEYRMLCAYVKSVHPYICARCPGHMFERAHACSLSHNYYRNGGVGVNVM